MDDLQIKTASTSQTSQPVTDQSQSSSTSNTSNTRAYNLAADAEASQSQALTAEKFIIPKLAQEKHPELIQMIKETESMDDEERQYWFQILPIMSDDQVEKLKGILQSEKDELKKLDQEYESELQKLNEKHLIEWKEFESKEKSKAIKTAESKEEEKEKKLEEELLAKLSNI